MLFNSINYLFFLPIIFVIYWLLNSRKLEYQNLFLLAASYFFYACWDWKFLFLLMFSTGLDYVTGLQIFNSKTAFGRKVWLWISIGINLGFLGVFKYFNFFAASFIQMFEGLGIHLNSSSIDIILPVGISFYTFHGLSYVIDIYKNRIEPERNVVDYSLFVSYFPLLVAGPIERATHLLPQLKKKRIFNSDKAIDGLQQILWGLFKKIVIADTCATYANAIFDHYESANSLTLLLGGVYFAFQIYGDFSGYSDIALGTSKLFGMDLLRNFNYPYFSRDIAEFWRRWHISLSSWFKDYLYIPLGGSKGGMWMKIRNTFIIFLVSGFWHGANWTFVFWGFLNALYFMPLLISSKNRSHIDTVALDKKYPSLKEFAMMSSTFFLTVIAWIFFRAKSITEAFLYLQRMFSFNFDTVFQKLNNDRFNIEFILVIMCFVIFEWNNRTKEHPLYGSKNILKAAFILALILCLGRFSDASEFIYFQF